MVARSFQVRHNDSDFLVVYDTDDGLEVLKYQLFSLTSVPPDEQKLIGADDDRVVSDDTDLYKISEKLRLVSISEARPESTAGKDESLNSDEELARMLHAEEEALMYQQFAVPEDNGAFEQRVRPYVRQVQMYEDPIRQEAARKTVPVEQLEEKALVSLAKEGNFTPSKKQQDHAFLLQLFFWFKQSFSWVNEPPCDSCGKKTISLGMDVALPPELLHGGSRVEIYRCSSCSTVTRFPRYNDPLKLVETRRGRCGEWANCFTLYCRAFGYESRLILDFTDHVWTECFSESLGRWMHLDPCEGVYDKPLLYESGWNKKLNYVIAIWKDGVCDITKRYTRKWNEVLSRRNIIAESALSSVLANITREIRRGFTSQVLSALDDRDEKERQEIERDLHSTEDTSTSLPGRRSGDKEWRKSRMEDGSDDSCALTGSCPLRQCVDEHVTKIYNGFLPILSQLVDKGFPKSRAVEVLETLKEILINLKKSPFKTRRVSIDSIPNVNQSVVRQLLPSFTELLSALSLSSKVDSDGSVEISLAGHAVKTSLALPVTFHALDVTIRNLKSCENFTKDSLCSPFLKLNRIHSGVVLASGEEIPFGIVTSAFDGTRMSKWEEPNGAKGCWVMYKVLDNQMHELVAYELMSANDAPERDPMDWVVEGSKDGGSSWQLLDKQTSQVFDGRFQCRAFKVSSKGFQSNAFRFIFLRVRDIQSNSRLQLGSIDLYSRSS